MDKMESVLPEKLSGNSDVELTEGAMDKMEAVLPEKLSGNSDKVLERVSLLQQTYSKNANSAQARFFQLRLSILSLTTLAAFLAVLYAELKKHFVGTNNTNNQIVEIVGYCLMIVPILSSVLLAGSIKLDKGSNWILLRGASEALKREMYFYRTQVGDYEKERACKLVDKIKLISEGFKGSPVHKACFDPNEDELKQKSLSPSLNPSLSPEDYISERLDKSFSYYRGKSKKLSNSLQLYRWSIYFLGGLSTLLAATGFQAWVAVSSCLILEFGLIWIQPAIKRTARQNYPTDRRN